MDSLQAAIQRLEVRDENLIAYSLLNLPLQTQDVYRILLMVPIGAFMMLILRNLVGIKTFGTFMPVLIAISFKWTSLFAGIGLFMLVVGLGLLVRFYMERLKLLLVPRLTAVLIVVVLIILGNARKAAARRRKRESRQRGCATEADKEATCGMCNLVESSALMVTLKYGIQQDVQGQARDVPMQQPTPHA